MTRDERIEAIRHGRFECGCQAAGAVALLLAELDDIAEKLANVERLANRRLDRIFQLERALRNVVVDTAHPPTVSRDVLEERLLMCARGASSALREGESHAE